MSDLTSPPSPSAKKSRLGLIVLISLVVLVGVGVGGWFVACAIATQAAKDHLETSVIGTPYEGMVSYDKLSATPFGAFEATNMRIGDPAGDPAFVMSAEKVVGRGHEKGDGISGTFDLTLTGLVMPVQAVARMNNQPLSTYQDLMDMGYDRVSGDMTMSWSYDQDSGDVAMILGIDYDDMMTLNLGLKMAGTDLSSTLELNEIKALPQSQQQAAFAVVLPRIMSENASAKLVSFSLDANFRPFAERYGKENPWFTPNEMAASVEPDLFLLAGQSPQEAEISVAAVKAMLLEGKMVRLRTNIKDPLPLITVVQPQGGEAFAKALNLTVTN